MNTTTHLPVDSIEYHALLADLPGLWPDDSPEMMGLVEDVRSRGIDEPLIVVESEDGAFLLIDGRHRLRAAQFSGLIEVPVVVRPEEEAADIILGTLVHRRHYLKGALAYLSYPVIAHQQATHGGNRGNQYKKVAKSTQSTLASAEEICARLGFGRDLYFQAKGVHDFFRRSPGLRAEYEPRILSGEIGLGACLAGLSGKEATERQKRQDRPPLELITEAFRAVQMRFDHWDRLEGSARRAVTQEATETFLKLPDEVQESVLRAYKTAKK